MLGTAQCGERACGDSRSPTRRRRFPERRECAQGVPRACAGGWKCAAWCAASPCTTTLHTIRQPSRERLVALRLRIGAARLIAVLEPRSNTMKLGTHREALAKALARCGSRLDVPGTRACSGTSPARSLRSANGPACSKDIDDLTTRLVETAAAGDHVLIMSNGGFGGIHTKLLERLRARTPGVTYAC